MRFAEIRNESGLVYVHDIVQDGEHLHLMINRGGNAVTVTLNYQDVQALRSAFEVWSQ